MSLTCDRHVVLHWLLDSVAWVHVALKRVRLKDIWSCRGVHGLARVLQAPHTQILQCLLQGSILRVVPCLSSCASQMPLHCFEVQEHICLHCLSVFTDSISNLSILPLLRSANYKQLHLQFEELAWRSISRPDLLSLYAEFHEDVESSSILKISYSQNFGAGCS